MRSRAILALVLSLCLVLGPAGLALAKKSGGSFSSGGSRSSSSGWSSSSRPSTPSAPSGSSSSSSSGWSSGSTTRQATPAQPSGSGQLPSSGQQGSSGSSWSNSGGAATSSGAKAGGTSAFSSSGSDAVKRQASTASFKDYQGKYAKSGNAVPGQVGTNKPILNQNRTFGSYQDYDAYRGSYYAGRGWSTPGYAFNSFSSFGMWDAMFMWFMLSNLTSGAGFFHNRQNDPGVQAFRQEAQKLSESNADLKKQVDELNTKLDAMKKEGKPVDPDAPLPSDVDPNVALAQPRIEESGGGTGWLLPLGMVLVAGGIGYMVFARRRA